MSEATDRAQRIRETMGTAGWREILAILDERIREPKDRLYAIMGRKPEDLTGKTALKLAIRAKALEDFKEEVLDTQKLLQDSRP